MPGAPPARSKCNLRANDRRPYSDVLLYLRKTGFWYRLLLAPSPKEDLDILRFDNPSPAYSAALQLPAT